MISLQQALHDAVLLLNDSPSPRIDAEVLLCHILQKPSSYLYTWPERTLTLEQEDGFNALIARRKIGEPVAYIVGYRDFWSLRLKVSPSTLIPRADTEVLVELALERLPKQGANVIDLGTGTGAIALSLASERNDILVTGIDLREDAVLLARENQKQLGIENVRFMQSDWFNAVKTQKFDMIVSNPPYIDEKDPHLHKGDVRFEPSSALISAQEGILDIQKICQQSVKYLEINGWLLIEHGFEQGQIVREIFTKTGFVDIATKLDYNRLERVTLGRMPA